LKKRSKKLLQIGSGDTVNQDTLLSSVAVEVVG
jgi:hypothetical protein